MRVSCSRTKMSWPYPLPYGSESFRAQHHGRRLTTRRQWIRIIQFIRISQYRAGDSLLAVSAAATQEEEVEPRRIPCRPLLLALGFHPRSPLLLPPPSTPTPAQWTSSRMLEKCRRWRLRDRRRRRIFQLCAVECTRIVHSSSITVYRVVQYHRIKISNLVSSISTYSIFRPRLISPSSQSLRPRRYPFHRQRHYHKPNTSE